MASLQPGILLQALGAGFYASFEEMFPYAKSSHRSPDTDGQSIYSTSLRSLYKVLAHHLGSSHGLSWRLYNPQQFRSCG